MSELFSRDRGLMYGFNQVEGTNCFPDYSSSSGAQLTDSTMAYARSGQQNTRSTYSNVPVHHWSSQNCVEWAEEVCYQYSLNTFSADIGALSNTNGSYLVQLSYQDWCIMLGKYCGQLFYNELQNLKSTNETIPGESPDYFSPSPDIDSTSLVSYDYTQEFYGSNGNMNSGYQEQFMPSPYTDNSNQYVHHESYDSYVSNSNLADQLNGGYNGFSDLDDNLDDLDFNCDDGSLENIQLYDLDTNLAIRSLSYDMSELQVTTESNCQKIAVQTNSHMSVQTEKKPRKKKERKDVIVSNNTVQELCKNVQGSGKYIRCPKNWEFLMRLLVNNETNPEVICWEDEAQYMFRIVQKEKLMELWNAKTGKSSGNFDNFSRGLRYHYKSGILSQVPEKQLVYRCGPACIEYLKLLKSQF